MSLENVFKKAKNSQVKTPPYMATRIMAEYKDRKSKVGKILIWQVLSGLSVTACAILIWVLAFKGPVGSFEAELFSPYVVKVDLAEPGQADIQEVEIILPDGVEFYSKSFPELRDQRSLRLVYDGNSNELPFVIQGLDTGKQKVKVKFWDGQENVVFEKSVEIEFKPEVEG